MDSRKRGVDGYPEFAVRTLDNWRSEASAVRQISARRAASYARDMEHAPITFLPATAAGGGGVIPVNDDSRTDLATMRDTATQPDSSVKEAEICAIILPATARQTQHTPAPPQRMRWLRIISGTTLCLALVAAAGWAINELRNPDTLPLRSVRIEGAFTHVTTEDLQQAIAGASGGGFLYANVDALRQAALQVPWVRSVNVRRVWPDTLHVSITEHAAAARWGDQGLLSDEGKVFSPEAASYPPGLPELHGPAGSQALVLSQYRAMSATLAPLNLRIKRIDLDARRAWRLSLDNGSALLLGRADSNAHLQRFVQVYPSLLATPAGNSMERVDMRYGNGLAVRWGKTSMRKSIHATSPTTQRFVTNPGILTFFWLRSGQPLRWILTSLPACPGLAV